MFKHVCSRSWFRSFILSAVIFSLFLGSIPTTALAATDKYSVVFSQEDWEINVQVQSAATGGWQGMTMQDGLTAASWTPTGAFATNPFYVKAYWAELQVGLSNVTGIDIDFMITDNVGLPIAYNSGWCRVQFYKRGSDSLWYSIPVNVTRTSNTSYRIQVTEVFDEPVNLQMLKFRFVPEDYDGSSSQKTGVLVNAGTKINVSIPESSQATMAWSSTSSSTGTDQMITQQQQTNGLLASLINSVVDMASNIFELPARIGNFILDGLADLFLPREGFFDDLIEEFQIEAETQFGFLYTASESIVSFLSIFVSNIQPVNEITLPAYSLPGFGQIWPAMTFPIIPDQIYNGVYKTTLQPLLVGVMSLGFVFYCMRQLKAILSGQPTEGVEDS